MNLALLLMICGIGWNRKMNNFELTTQFFEKYSNKYGVDFPDDFVSDLIKTSNDSESNVSLYTNKTNNLNVLDMDVFAKKIYYRVWGQNMRDNTFNSPDAFLVNSDNHWFFIEFKNSQINAQNTKTKSNVLKKAFCIVYSIIDVLSDVNECYILSAYSNPLSFFRTNVTYILVCSNDKNPTVSQRNVQQRITTGKYRYTPEFMQKINSYLFCNAYVYTEKYFEEEFVKNFKY